LEPFFFIILSYDVALLITFYIISGMIAPEPFAYGPMAFLS